MQPQPATNVASGEMAERIEMDNELIDKKFLLHFYDAKLDVNVLQKR